MNDEQKYYREVSLLTIGQVDCIVNSERAPDEVWIAAALVIDWLQKRAANQHGYQVMQDVERVTKRAQPVSTRGRRVPLVEDVPCVLVSE